MEFLGNVFSILIFEQLLSHEALVSGRVTATSRAGLKPVQPMQLHWAPRHGVWVD